MENNTTKNGYNWESFEFHVLTQKMNARDSQRVTVGSTVGRKTVKILVVRRKKRNCLIVSRNKKVKMVQVHTSIVTPPWTGC